MAPTDTNPHEGSALSAFETLLYNTVQGIAATPSGDEKFTYAALEPNQIRLVVIIPDDTEGSQSVINCVLLHVDIHNLPPFECLSYWWGPAKDQSGYVRCNGKPFLVTRQLLTAFWCLRAGMQKARVLWVDQICINQENDKEKSSQVVCMPVIYAEATRVLFFPGVDEKFGLAFDFIISFCDAYTKSFMESESSAFKTAWLNRTSEDLYRIAKIPRPNDAGWVAVRALLASPCFHRTWIVQELALAKDVQIILAQMEVRFDLENYTGFGSFMTMLSGRHDRLGGDYVGNTFKDARTMFGIRSVRTLLPTDPMLKLLNLLNITRDFGYTDPKDKIYGLLSVASDAEQLGILPNYEQSVETCYTTAARRIISTSNSLQIFLSCQTLQRNESWPTWVPDWRSTRLETFPYPIPTKGNRREFGASQELPLSMRDVNDERKLGIQGIPLDTITKVSEGPIDQTDLDFYLENIFGYSTWWMRAYHALGSVYEHTGEPLALALGRTRIADDQEQELRGDSNIWPSYKVRKEEGSSYFFHEHTRKIATNTIFRKLFTTSRKYMGLAPLTAREGDQVFLLPGANVPYVLRNVESDEYQLIGQCYTHGIMFGEGVDAASVQNLVLV